MYRQPLVPLVLVLFLFCLSGTSLAQDLQTAQFPSVESVCRIESPITFCGHEVPLHLRDVRERLEKEVLLMHWNRAQTLLWLKRTGRYFPHIEELLKANNMPDDLKYLPVIESALRPNVGSHAGARGIWQFIRSTGRKYGLEVDRCIDDRRNFYLATKAAIKYLKKLHEQFGSWALAAAAYNMGENGLEKAIKKQEIKDYYRLHLPEETERYVLRIVAAKLLMSDPARYGFRLLPTDFYQPVRFDRLKLRCRDWTPVMLVAKASNTTYKEIRDLNPQIQCDKLPVGTHLLFLPKGSAKKFAKRYKPLARKYRAEHQKVVHTVKRGESLLRIARRYHVSLSSLLRKNGLSRSCTIYPGQRLIIKP